MSNFSQPRIRRPTVGLPLASSDPTLPSPQKRSPLNFNQKCLKLTQGDNSESGDGPDAGHGAAPPHHPRRHRRREHEDHLQSDPSHHRAWPQCNSFEVTDHLSYVLVKQFSTKKREN